MEVQYGPSSVDEPGLLYKVQRKIKVFNTNNPFQNRGYNLISSSSKYGIVFIASPKRILSVYYLRDLINKENEPHFYPVQLQLQPTHIAVNCDQEWLAVIGGQMIMIYKCLDFQNPNIGPSVTLKCDVAPTTFVSSLQWNPCIPDTIGIVYFDGSLVVSQVSTMQMKKIQCNARCLCWSPKGKQLVTGNNDGTLTQYKPDLSPMKMVPAPNLFEGAPVEAMAIYWISTYQFAVTFKNASDNSRPVIAIVNTPKGGQATCINYEDICYSMGSNRPWYYYLQGLAQWNMILTSSSNSMEIATLASPDGSNWLQWCQPDEARPELPLTNKKEENYPMGLCIDTCAVHQLPWGENETLPPMPLLHVVSQTGLLTIFNVINLKKSAAQVCIAPQPFQLPNASLTSEIPNDVPVELPQEQPQQKAQPIQPQPIQLIHQPQPQTFQPQTIPSVQSQVVQPQAIQPQLQKQAIQPQTVQPQAVGSQSSFIPQAPQLQPLQSLQSQVQQLSNLTMPPLLTQTEIADSPASIKKDATPQALTIKQTNQINSQSAMPLAEANAALKLEQKKANKAKVNQELKNLLIKEVNDFQMELYTFKKTMYETLNKLNNDIQSVNPSFNVHSLDLDKLKKDCDIDDLRESIIQLKLDLVRTCAVVAETRSHLEAKDYEWTQMDPLTVQRIASIKKLAYYVQTQLDQAQKVLDRRWDEWDARNQYTKPGGHMIRPILDDVYQPLVKQQEILSRQQAVLRTLRNTMKECDLCPKFKSTSLLRSTPFRNKDPLSKLTKNILNMSIEPQNNKAPSLNSQKLDALRDMLSNHKPIKVKPIDIDLRQHMENLKIKYEKNLKEKEMKQANENASPVESKADVKTITLQVQKSEPINIPSFTPVNNVKPKIESSVVRTLFTDESKPEVTKPTEVINIKKLPPEESKTPAKPVAPPPYLIVDQSTLDSDSTRKLLQSFMKSETPPVSKNDTNFFMGQKICSPTVFTGSKPPSFDANPSQPMASFATSGTFYKFSSMSQKPEDKVTFEFPRTEEKVTFNNQKEKISYDAPRTEEKVFFGVPKTEQKITFGALKPDEKISFGFPKSEEKISFGASKATEKVSSAASKSEETGEQESKTTFKSFFGKPVDLKSPIFGKSPQSTSNVPDVLKGGQSFIFGKVEQKSVLQPIEKDSEKSKENIPQPANQIIENKSEKNETKSQIQTNNGKFIGQPPKVEVNMQPEINAEKSESPALTLVNIASTSEPKPSTTTEATITQTKVTEAISSMLAETAINVSSTVSSPVISSTSNLISKNDAKVESELPSASVSASNVSTSSAFTLTGTSNASSKISVSTSETLSSAFVSVSQQSPTEIKPVVLSTQTPVTATNTSTTTPNATESQPVFDSNTSTVSTPTGSILGAKTTQSSIFEPSTTHTVFGQTNTTSVFSNTSPAQSLFSAAATNVFGSTATTTSQSIFGSSTGQPAFSSSPGFATNASPVFGTAQGSIFGSPAATTQASVFGSSVPTPQASVFGSPQSPSSIFGAATTQSGSIFGTSTTNTQSSVFGTPTTTQTASIFGTPTTNTQSGSIFGAATTNAPSGSLFGSPTTTTQSGSIFGGAESNIFAAASISTTSASNTSGGNIFGGGSSVFGSSAGNVFGSKATFGGTNASATNIFGGGSTFGQKPATDFWSASGGNASGSPGFGQQTTPAQSIFGSASGGSFSSPSAGQPFGSPQGPFSGGESKSVFGTPPQQTGTAFGGGSVFGAKPVFGGSPSFGTSTFGGFNKSPTSGFGSSASFGGGATFGGSAFGGTSPGQTFGGSSPGFGASTQSNATFESLATQNTLTFGNLAQQSGQPAAQPTQSFNTSPSFTGWRC